MLPPSLAFTLAGEKELTAEAGCAMLQLFRKRFQAWRKALAQYLGVAEADAKKELIRVFYGGRPRHGIPWLRKLGHEVQTAANLILQDPSLHHLMHL